MARNILLLVNLATVLLEKIAAKSLRLLDEEEDSDDNDE